MIPRERYANGSTSDVAISSINGREISAPDSTWR